MDSNVREPKQQRAIEKKEKIIDVGFELICKNGYYNTNTAEIAKLAGVSTGIVYQYFKDKHDIFIAAINKYGDDIFFPMLNIKNKKLDIRRWWGSGGMPSSHSAFVCSLATAVGLTDGLDSASFAISLALAAVVMYDASGVRRAAGKQAKILNQLIET